MYADGLPVRDELTVCVHTFRLPFARWRPWFETGAHCVVPETRQLPPECVDPKTKNRSRLHWHLAERAAKQVDPAAVPLLLDFEGNLTETPAANFLLFKDGVVFSPPAHKVLGGISKQTVQEISEELGWQWVENELQIRDALNADEAWLTSTPYCIAPCVRLNGEPIGSGAIGDGYRAVLRAWSTRVGCDIAAQIRKTT
jgi:branched-subunit amino acid aminotransferase/4-amino-4-deoxychorismate lyase